MSIQPLIYRIAAKSKQPAGADHGQSLTTNKVPQSFLCIATGRVEAKPLNDFVDG
jgi:hypothetical protein